MTPVQRSPIRIGTRGSRLALAQTDIVIECLRALETSVETEVVTIKTQGDIRTEVPLSTIGGQGVFAAELELALRDGRVDIAVHSAKDLPSTVASDMLLAAFLSREDARDVLVAPLGTSLTINSLPEGARVGTSSPRRNAELRRLRPDLQLVDIRGNVDTRLRKLDEGEYDALVLAAAGLRRLGLAERITQSIDINQMVPAVGQGAIAIECRANDNLMASLLRRIDHSPTRHAVEAERAFLARLGAGCSAPAGAHAVVAGDRLHLVAFIEDANGAMHRAEQEGATRDAATIGRMLSEELLKAAGDLPVRETIRSL